MAVTSLNVENQDLHDSQFFRLDPKLYVHHAAVRDAFSSLIDFTPFGQLASFANGLNLPKSAYADPEDAVLGHYLSVKGLAGYTFDESMCNPLRKDTATGFLLDPEETQKLAVRANEVLITRSRATAPGLSMSGAEVERDSRIIPSGFVIRANLNSDINATFVTAILNHPAWRTFTAGIAAGKSQDNLSQELLSAVPIPDVDEQLQSTIASRYRQFLSEVARISNEEERFADACDAIIQHVLGLAHVSDHSTRVQSRRVSLLEVAESRGLRLDNRWHGQSFRNVVNSLVDVPVEPLGSYVTAGPDKGRQPTWVLDGEATDESAYGVATGSIRYGQIVPDLMKQTTTASVAAFPVQQGDLLVAMDGDGSVGKAAVVTAPDAVTVDSHLARIRIREDTGLAEAISCWLNSSWGLAQTNGMMSGATGQTQLAATDLLSVLIPRKLADKSSEIAAQYRSAIEGYTPPSHRIREQLCLASVDVAQCLLDAGVISRPAVDSDIWGLDWTQMLTKRIYNSSR